jgi:hypothetical protein
MLPLNNTVTIRWRWLNWRVVMCEYYVLSDFQIDSSTWVQIHTPRPYPIPDFGRVCFAQSLVFCVAFFLFYRRWSFFVFWPIYCLSYSIYPFRLLLWYLQTLLITRCVKLVIRYIHDDRLKKLYTTRVIGRAVVPWDIKITKIGMGKSSRTDNILVKRQKMTSVDKTKRTLHRKLRIEQNKLHQNRGWGRGGECGFEPMCSGSVSNSKLHMYMQINCRNTRVTCIVGIIEYKSHFKTIFDQSLWQFSPNYILSLFIIHVYRSIGQWLNKAYWSDGLI